MCYKQPYESRNAAEQTLRKIQKQKNSKQKPKRTYKCLDCGKWHLTSGN